jgi:hypothetical protein
VVSDLEHRKQLDDLELMDGVDRHGFTSKSLIVQTPFRSDARRPHYIQNSRRETEQQEHNQSPRRGAQPAVDQPAKTRSHQHARDQLGREPKPACECRGICGLPRVGAVFGWAVRCCDPFAETLEPRGELSLVVRRIVTFAFASRAVSHAFDSRGYQASCGSPP